MRRKFLRFISILVVNEKKMHYHVLMTVVGIVLLTFSSQARAKDREEKVVSHDLPKDIQKGLFSTGKSPLGISGDSKVFNFKEDKEKTLSHGFFYKKIGEETSTPAENLTPKEQNYNPPKARLEICSSVTEDGYTINFEDISIIQLLQFVSKISGINFVFDAKDLQFNVTIVSQDPTSVDDISTILLQVLKMHDLQVIEQGNNVLIYKNPNLAKLSTVVTEDNIENTCEAIVVTRVFKLYTLKPEVAVTIIKPLLSSDAIVSASEATNHIVVSDISGNVDKIAELIAALDSPDAAKVELAEYHVLHANPITLINYCEDVLGAFLHEDTYQIFSQPGTNKIFIISTPTLIKKSLQVLHSLDQPDLSGPIEEPVATGQTTFFMYKLKYQNGNQIAQALRFIGSNLYITTSMNQDFINTINTASWVEVNNSIVIVGSKKNVDKVVNLLDGLDLPPKQVYIEVLILETALENSWDFGVQWIALGQDHSHLAYSTGLLNNSDGSNSSIASSTTNIGNSAPPKTATPGAIPLPTPNALMGMHDLANASAAFGMGIIGNVLSHKGKSFLSLGALLSALDEDGDTVIVLNPRIMAQDTQQANFFVGQNIPFQTTSTVIQETGSVTQNIDYEDVGVELVVTSTIAPNNVVSLQIEQTISELQSAIGNLTPTTNKTFASTRLQVPDGCFLVMSGHIRDKIAKVHSGVPILGSVPILRSVFSRTIEQRQKRNIMMFIKPKVISTFEQGTILTNKEGYKYNWEADKSSLDVAPRQAPECVKVPKVMAPEDNHYSMDVQN